MALAATMNPSWMKIRVINISRRDIVPPKVWRRTITKAENPTKLTEIPARV